MALDRYMEPRNGAGPSAECPTWVPFPGALAAFRGLPALCLASGPPARSQERAPGPPGAQMPADPGSWSHGVGPPLALQGRTGNRVKLAVVRWLAGALAGLDRTSWRRTMPAADSCSAHQHLQNHLET